MSDIFIVIIYLIINKAILHHFCWGFFFFELTLSNVGLGFPVLLLPDFKVYKCKISVITTGEDLGDNFHLGHEADPAGMFWEVRSHLSTRNNTCSKEKWWNINSTPQQSRDESSPNSGPLQKCVNRKPYSWPRPHFGELFAPSCAWDWWRTSSLAPGLPLSSAAELKFRTIQRGKNQCGNILSAENQLLKMCSWSY